MPKASEEKLYARKGRAADCGWQGNKPAIPGVSPITLATRTKHCFCWLFLNEKVLDGADIAISCKMVGIIAVRFPRQNYHTSEINEKTEKSIKNQCTSCI